MKRISTWSLSVCTIVGALAFAGCSSGESDPNTTPAGGSGGVGGSGAAGSGGTGGSSGSGGSGGTGGDSGSGGSGGSGGPTTGVCANNVRELPLAEAFVDDFETDTRFDGWYSFADTDAVNHNQIAREASGALSTTMAGHVSATGVQAPTAGGFGAGFGFGMKDATGACAGVAAFDGVSFWAKGTAGADNALRFQAVVAATQAVADGGDCTANCFNHPAKTITLTAEWKQYTVLWTELAGPVAVNGVILGLNWITPGPAFDIWVDEVTLFAGTAPTGPVGAGADGGT